jgi:hypothetical protein
MIRFETSSFLILEFETQNAAPEGIFRLWVTIGALNIKCHMPLLVEKCPELGSSTVAQSIFVRRRSLAMCLDSLIMMGSLNLNF